MSGQPKMWVIKPPCKYYFLTFLSTQICGFNVRSIPSFRIYVAESFNPAKISAIVRSRHKKWTDRTNRHIRLRLFKKKCLRFSFNNQNCNSAQHPMGMEAVTSSIKWIKCVCLCVCVCVCVNCSQTLKHRCTANAFPAFIVIVNSSSRTQAHTLTLRGV